MLFNTHNANIASKRLPLKILLITLTFTFLLFATFSWFSWVSYKELKKSQVDVLNIIELKGLVLQYDEVLTMSAKIASLTGNIYWEERYKKFEPLLDLAIKKLMAIAPEPFTGKSASKTNAANINLVAIEHEAFKLVKEGKLKKATALLVSEEYENEKINYTAGMQQIKKNIEAQVEILLENQRRRVFLLLIASIVSIPLLIFTWIVTYRNFKIYLDKNNKAEESLRKSETHLRTLIETLPDLIWLKDPDGVYLTCNPKFERFFGAKQHEIIGKTDYEFVDKELADFFREKDKAAVALGRSSLNEEDIIYADDGHKENLETIKTPMFDSKGILIGVLGVGRDITNRKEIEFQLRQAHKMQAIGTLAGGIAHDFNNLLAVILGYADMAMDDIPEHNPAKDQIEQVLLAANRARDLVSHILSFSRKGAKERSPVQIHLLVEEALKLLRASIPTTIEIKQSIDSQCGNILADPTQIHQVLMNLCTNAAQSMDENGGVLEVEITSLQLMDDPATELNLKPGNYVRLSIKDNGIGIEQKYLDRIFDPYFTTKSVGKGSGMGLAVVIGIVKSHDGAITVESKPDKGSTFTVYFPKIEKLIQDEIENTDPLPTGKEKFLIVDDEENIVKMNTLMFERLGYQITAKTSSVEALELFRSQPNAYDMVITDHTMPDLTGEQLAKKLIEIRHDIPIIICTGYSSKMDAEKASAIGISAFVMKPIAKRELAKTVRQVLDEKHHLDKSTKKSAGLG